MSVPRGSVWFEPATHLVIVFAVFTGLWAGDGAMALAYALGAAAFAAFGWGVRRERRLPKWGGLAVGVAVTAFTAARVWLSQ
jgi:hypothetical protein